MTTPAEKISAIIAMTDRLGEIVAAENELLAARRSSEIGAHRDEKARLSEAYEREMADLKANRSWLAASADEDIARLKASNRSFHAILAKHRRAVLAAKTVTERMLRAIGEEIAKRQRPLNSYGQDATLNSAFGGRSGPAVSVALNQVV